ncbi:MAG TPA: hypothetical protein H9871_12695 [Candidatus Nesterenkonia stercoripullorum]|uniref:Uncharacterized protein n=1 Tax=Candidatus Nesterenkonia stercoripullorum TaxID=2838701 RepID=A0A9D1UV32_9MICC|nr:hypothetical protein [Candidatus Nesterenkonia stercoripullorum]
MSLPPVDLTEELQGHYPYLHLFVTRAEDMEAHFRIGYRHGLVESKTLAVDATWSAIKFTHPRPGQHYNNSFGTLPEGT